MNILIIDNKFTTSCKRYELELSKDITIARTTSEVIDELSQKDNDLVIFISAPDNFMERNLRALCKVIKSPPCFLKASLVDDRSSLTSDSLKKIRQSMHEISHTKKNHISFLSSENILMYEGANIYLTSTKFKLAKFFYDRKNKTLLKETIEEYLWGKGTITVNHNLSTHLTNLKKKVNLYKQNLKNVRGKGYKFHLNA